MELKVSHWVGIFLGLIVIGGSFLLIGTAFFFFAIGFCLFLDKERKTYRCMYKRGENKREKHEEIDDKERPF